MTAHKPDMSAVVAEARELIGRYRWDEAADLLRPIDPDDLPAEGLDLLGQSAWWNGEIDKSIEWRERAFARYLEEDDQERAGRIALLLAEDNLHQLKESLARSWLARAEQILTEHPESAGAGWLERMRAVVAFEGTGDYGAALAAAQRAHDIAKHNGDTDLFAIALHDQGRALVALGRLEEGLGLMEEVMVAAVAGELGPLSTGKVYCNMIDIYGQMADYRSASEWDEAARRWCERSGQIKGFPGVCRVKRAEIMRLRGSWEDAESEARRACEELTMFLDLTGKAYEEIGMVRLQMGDLDGADEAFRQAIHVGHDPEPGLALLKMAEGNAASAHALMDRAFSGEDRTKLALARLAPARVEIAIQNRDFDVARETAQGAQEYARDLNTDALNASAAYATGLVAHADGDLKAAEKQLRQAATRWRQTDLPFEAARARLALARVYADRDLEDLASIEAEAAQSTFLDLGASLALDETTKFLDSLGKTSRPIQAAWMFTDIVGSTDLIRAIGDEAWGNVLRWHDDTLRALFTEHEGNEVHSAGDGFLVEFADAVDAVACAIAIQKVVAGQRARQGFPARLRIGIHSGRAIETGDSPQGGEVHRAARVAAAAGADEILVTGAVVEVTGVDVGEPRAIDAKGFDEPVQVWPVAAASALE